MNQDERDTTGHLRALRQNPTARKVRARFPRGTRVQGRVGGQTGTVNRHVPGGNAQGGVLLVDWDNGSTGRTGPASVMAVEEIRDLEWRLAVHLPHEMKTTTNARRLASLRRQRVEITASLAALRVGSTS